MPDADKKAAATMMWIIFGVVVVMGVLPIVVVVWFLV